MPINACQFVHPGQIGERVDRVHWLLLCVHVLIGSCKGPHVLRWPPVQFGGKHLRATIIESLGQTGLQHASHKPELALRNSKTVPASHAAP